MSPYWHHIESDIQIEVTSCKVNLEGVEFTGRDGLGRRRYSFLTAKQLCYNSNFGQVHWIPLRISDPQIGCCAARSGLVISGFYFHKILETQNRKNAENTAFGESHGDSDTMRLVRLPKWD